MELKKPKFYQAAALTLALNLSLPSGLWAQPSSRPINEGERYRQEQIQLRKQQTQQQSQNVKPPPRQPHPSRPAGNKPGEKVGGYDASSRYHGSGGGGGAAKYK